MRTILIYLFSGLLIVSCNQTDEPCLVSKSNPCVSGFYTYATDSLGERNKYVLSTYGSSVLLKNLSQLDTIFYWGQGVTQTSVPPNPFVDSMEFEVLLDSFQQTRDWVRVHFESEEIFVNLECGVAFDYTIKKVTHSTFRIDSVLIIDSILELNNSDENLQIIFN